MGFIYQLTLIAIINLFIFVVGANAPSAFLHPNKIYPWIDDNWHPGWRELSLIVLESTCNSSKKQQNNLHISCVFEKITLPLHPHSVLGKPVRFWHRPAAVICNIVCFVSKSLANSQLSTDKLGRLSKRAISQKTCCMHKGIPTRPRGSSGTPKLNALEE